MRLRYAGCPPILRHPPTTPPAMIPRPLLSAALAAAAILSLVATAGAQPVDTRLGTLQLENGFPSKAAVETLYDEMDFQRATQLYLWGLPAVGFHGLRLAHLRSFGAQDGEVVLYRSLADKAGMLTPNLTTLYAFSFWNLAERGPLVVVVPPGATAGTGRCPKRAGRWSG